METSPIEIKTQEVEESFGKIWLVELCSLADERAKLYEELSQDTDDYQKAVLRDKIHEIDRTDPTPAILGEVLRSLIEEKSANMIIVDLGNCPYLTSISMGLLVKYLQIMKDKSGNLLLSRVPPKVKRPLQITHLDEQFTIFDTLEQAIQFAKTN